MVAILCVLAFGVVSAGVLLRVSTTDSLPVFVRTVTGVSEVKVVPASNWRDARQGDPMAPGDSVRALPGGSVVLAYADGSLLVLTGGAEVKVSDSSQGREQPLMCSFQTFFGCDDVSGYSFVTTVIAGGAQARIQRSPNNSRSFQLQTANSIAEARSTVFEVELDQGGRAMWRTVEGQVSVGYLVQREDGTLAATATLLDAGATLDVKPLPPLETSRLAERAGLMAAAREAVHKAATSEFVVDLAREGKALSFPTPIGQIAAKPAASARASQMSEAGTSCLECHQELNAKLQGKSRHQPFVTGICANCHSYSHDGAGEHRTAVADIALCSSCHPQNLMGSSHPVGPQLIDAVTRGPLTCSSSCHDPHGSPYKALSRVGEGDRLCMNCHNPGSLGR